MTENKVFKIQRRSDGLFSMGGDAPLFNKVGKVWKRSRDLGGHLAIVRTKERYDDCDIVTMELVEVDRTPVSDRLEAMRQRKVDRDAERRAQWQAHQKKLRQQQYQQLKKEFEDD